MKRTFSTELAYVFGIVFVARGVVLMEKVWGVDYCGETRTVDMHIRTLRQKLGEKRYIINELGVGYRMLAEDET